MTAVGQVTVRRELMAATFAITIAHAQPRYARQAAQEALDEAERIGGRLSRFAEGSDIDRINRLGRGETTRVHPEVVDVLRIAQRVCRLTGGAFDIAYDSADRRSGVPAFRLDDKRATVEVLDAPIRLDLGGIGKGFALDRMAAMLDDWAVRSAFLCAGRSTVLACDAPPHQRGWPTTIGPSHDLRKLNLVRRAVSASGTSVRGEHIINPGSGEPPERRIRAWAVAPSAAVADALSTAFMVMSEMAIRELCGDHQGLGACLQNDPAGMTTVLGEFLWPAR